MPHIHTEPGQHDQTASAYIIRDDIGDQPRLLLHMHRKLNRLLQVGGHVELNEHPWQSIAHELLEEAGYRLDELSVLQPLTRIEPRSLVHSIVHPQPFLVNTHQFGDKDHFHTDSAYLLLAHQAPNIPPLEGESQDLRWLSLEEIIDLPNYKILDDTREICRAALRDFYGHWQPVPANTFK